MTDEALDHRAIRTFQVQPWRRRAGCARLRGTGLQDAVGGALTFNGDRGREDGACDQDYDPVHDPARCSTESR